MYKSAFKTIIVNLARREFVTDVGHASNVGM